ncbi:MAG TPA: hypothetical protein VF226_11855 [Hyphomicrobiaceae bacterium]
MQPQPNLLDVDHIEEAAALVAPGARPERGRRARVQLAPLAGEGTPDHERVQPQRLDLDRLADMRGTRTTVDFGVH